MKELQKALTSWQEVLGPEYVIRSEEKLTDAETTTHPSDHRILGILQPGTLEEVQRCVEIANETGVPLYPMSRGRNFGYGTRVPSVGNAVLLELKRLNRIVDYSEELAYAVIEPGVTFEQLYEFLEQRGSNLAVNVTGGPVDGSIIGNRLERGQGVGPASGIVAPTYDWEVVLPTGQVIHTAAGRYGVPSRTTQPFGPGPDFSGLFEQSGMGVVTKMTLWLEPKPKDVRILIVSMDDDPQLQRTVEALRELMLEGVVIRPVFTNDYRLAASALNFQYPWDEVDGKTPLPSSYLQGHPKWSGAIALLSYDAKIGRRREKIVADKLKGCVSSCVVIDPLKRNLAKMVLPIARATGFYDRLLSNVIDLPFTYRGKATGPAMNLPYWRKRGPIPDTKELNRDGCGLLWFAPIVPVTGRDMSKVDRTAREICQSHGFEPMANIFYWCSRSAMYLLAIIYDRENPGADERARACYEELFEQICVRYGYIPYRLSTSGLKMLPPIEDDWNELYRSIKAAIDPANVLRGRYAFEHD